MEGVLKAMLARFWEYAEVLPGWEKPRRAAPFHPRVKAMLRWAEAHYREPDALKSLYREADMSPNYFRRLFTRTVGCGPHAYLERMRLRQARHLLYATDWQLKRIAAEVGYDDPLYFSRVYRRFWKHPPSGER
jgi:transcriptional regulator GlxA family with amidase domain